MIYLILILLFNNIINQRPENYDQKYLYEIENKLEGALLTKIDMKFINGMIRKYKPKKILEIGVASGGSSAIILNAIQNIENSHLYSIDKLTNAFNVRGKETGWIVKEKFSNLMNKWTLYTGGITSNFIEKIGGDIDLVFIDTVHESPGEWLDVIQVMPFLKKTNAIVILHDIRYHLHQGKVFFSSNDHLFTYLKGEKIIPKVPYVIPNIGAVLLDDDQKKYYFDYFFALISTWNYIPDIQEWNFIRNFVSKYYSKELIEIYDSSYKLNKNYKKIIKGKKKKKYRKKRYGKKKLNKNVDL
jgi:predicted O-methyltransferase YrrM